VTAWQQHRLVAVDAARGVALLGMMAVHVVPPLRPDGTVSTAYLLAAGRSAALFAVLAGVGLALLSGGATGRQGRPLRRAQVAVVVRAVLLVALGLWLGTLDSGVAVILVYYGVLFVLAAPFLGLGPTPLAWLAAGTALVVPVLSHLVRPALPVPSYDVPTLAMVSRPGQSLAELTLTGYYPALPWLAYLFAGLAVGRLVLTERRVAVRLLVGGLALAVGARVVSALLLGPLGGLDALRVAQPELFTLPLDVALRVGLFGTTPTGSPWWLAVATPHTATPLDLATTIGSSLAVLGLLLLVLPRPRWWAAPLVAVGGMTLTLYTLHVLLLAGPLPGGSGLAWVAHVLVAVAVALPWRRFVGQGPLEWVTQKVAGALSRAAVPERPAVPRA
jgi:uncharacterized membrane protein